ncbi:uncharacterized protein LOC112590867, partial [Melanaphis sacchari]|uniref:uncharacterized protein LOC112590867 n=1 Tax=Melanaphis sacchari TaxID=742174 RepID=UPI000DC15007
SYLYRSPTKSSATIITNDGIIISPTIKAARGSLRLGRIPAISLRAAICVLHREQNHRGHRHLTKSELSLKADASNKRRTLNYSLH